MEESAKPIQTVVVDVEIPMGSLVMLMVKLAIAAIPAAFIIVIVYAFLGAVFAGLLTGGHH